MTTSQTLIAGILLCAGKSSRFGKNKLLQSLPGSKIPVALQSATTLVDILPFSFAIIPSGDSKLKNLLSPVGIHCIENHASDEGISSSIRTGIQAIQRQSQVFSRLAGFVIALGDMPFIPAAVIQEIAETVANGESICAPIYQGQRGHPVGFSVTLADELLRLNGDNGAKSIITKYKNDAYFISCDSRGILQDIDFPEDIYSNVAAGKMTL